MASSSAAPDSTNPSLLARVRLADEAAWQTLIDLYGPLVLSWCRRAGLGDADSDDVGQEVFMAVRRGLPSFRKERPEDTFRGWLRTITRSKVADHFRRNDGGPRAFGGSDALARQQALVDVRPEMVPELIPEADEPQELSELVQRGLNEVRKRFDDKSMRAFWGTAVEQRSAAEVGRELGLSANAVNIAKHRVRKALQLALGEVDPDSPPLEVGCPGQQDDPAET